MDAFNKFRLNGLYSFGGFVCIFLGGGEGGLTFFVCSFSKPPPAWKNK